MSIKQVCDICGHDDSNVTFKNTTLKLQIKNYKNESYNLYLTLLMQKTSDEDKLNNFYKQISKFPISEKSIQGIYEKLDLINLSKDENINTKINLGEEEINIPTLDNPLPIICDKCKKSLSALITKYGKNKLEKF